MGQKLENDKKNISYRNSLKPHYISVYLEMECLELYRVYL